MLPQMELSQIYPEHKTVSGEDAVGELELNEKAPAERPYVICNMISTADGKATIDGRAGPISDPIDRELFHLLRTQADAVLIGAGTLRKEYYGPLVKTPELADLRERSGLRRSQLACCITGTLDLSVDIPIFQDKHSEIKTFTTQPEKTLADCPAAVSIIRMGDSAVPLAELFQSLHQDGIRSVLCEGGPNLNAELLRADLLDELFLSLAPKLESGRDNLTIVHGDTLAQPTELELLSLMEANSSLYLRYRVKR